MPPNQLDSLRTIWNNTQLQDSTRFTALNTFIEQGYLRYDNDSAQYFAELHLVLALQKNNELQQAKALNLKGLSYAMRGNMDSCLVYFKKSYLIHKKIKNAYGEGRAAYNLGNVYSSTGPIDSAMYYYDYSAQIYETLQDTAGIAKGLFASSKMARRIGNYEFALKQIEKTIAIEKNYASLTDQSQSYVDQASLLKILSRYEEAAQAYKTAYALALKSGASSEIVNTMNGLIKLKLDSKEPKEALELISSALKEKDDNTEPYIYILTEIYKGHAYKDMNQLDSSEYAYKKALKLSETFKELGYSITALTSLAQQAEDQENFQEALGYYRQVSEERYLLSENPNKQVFVLFGFSNCYRNLGDLNKAINYAEQAVTLAEEQGDNGNAKYAYRCLHLAQEAAGDFNGAYNSLTKWNELRDLIDSEENQKAIVKLGYDYEYEKKSFTDSLNFATQKVILETETHTQKQRATISLVALGFISILSFFLFRLYRENKSKNVIISKALTEKDTLLREIHHRVKNNLQVISSLLRLQSNSTKDEAAVEALKEGQTRVQSMSLIHQNLYGKDNLTGIGMKNYLNELCANLIQTYSTVRNVNLNTEIEDLKLDVNTVVPLGLIINELVTNALKYAFPDDVGGEINISLCLKDEQLILKVEDNGVGFDSEQLDESESFGFGLINAFTSKLEADLKVESAQGTSVTLIINEFELV